MQVPVYVKYTFKGRKTIRGKCKCKRKDKNYLRKIFPGKNLSRKDMQFIFVNVVYFNILILFNSTNMH